MTTTVRGLDGGSIELADEAVDAFAEAALARPAPLTVVDIWHMGGAIADVGPEDTAFAERRSPFMVAIDGNWADPAMDAQCVAWVRDRWAAMAEHGTGSVYLNFTGDDDAAEAEVDSAYGRNLRRLADVKAAYDPGNLVRRNHNVVPAGEVLGSWPAAVPGAGRRRRDPAAFPAPAGRESPTGCDCCGAIRRPWSWAPGSTASSTAWAPTWCGAGGASGTPTRWPSCGPPSDRPGAGWASRRGGGLRRADRRDRRDRPIPGSALVGRPAGLHHSSGGDGDGTAEPG